METPYSRRRSSGLQSHISLLTKGGEVSTTDWPSSVCPQLTPFTPFSPFLPSIIDIISECINANNHQAAVFSTSKLPSPCSTPPSRARRNSLPKPVSRQPQTRTTTANPSPTPRSQPSKTFPLSLPPPSSRNVVLRI